MSKKNETPRTSVPNKPKESSIYRKIETLILDLIKRVDNVPNTPMIRELVCRLSNELIECLAAVKYAYTTPNYDIRFGYLSEMEVHLSLIKTIVNVLFEYASHGMSRFMIQEQATQYLITIDDIETQRFRWANSTLRNLQREEVSDSSCDSPFPVKQTPFREDYGVPENTQFTRLGADRIVDLQTTGGDQLLR